MNFESHYIFNWWDPLLYEREEYIFMVLRKCSTITHGHGQAKKRNKQCLKKIITTMHPSMWGFFLTKENPDRIRMDHFTIIDSI